MEDWSDLRVYSLEEEEDFLIPLNISAPNQIEIQMDSALLNEN